MINLRKLVKDHRSQANLADKVGVTASVISQLVTGHRAIGEKLARKIEQRTNKKELWLDQDHGGPLPGVPEPSLKDLWDRSSEDDRANFLRDLAAKS